MISLTKSPFKAIVVISSLGIQFAACLFAGYFVGSYLDRYFQTGQLLMVVGVLLGLGAGTYAVVKMVKPFLSD